MKNFIFLFALIFSASVWAWVPPQPDKCPAVQPIAEANFAKAQKTSDGTYGALMLGKFDTQAIWGFVIAEIPADSIEDALAKAKASLTSLNFEAGPMYFKTNNIWGCPYTLAAAYPV